MSIISPASLMRLVMSMSSGEGSSLPDGWLWATIKEAALSSKQGRNTSLGWTMVRLSIPVVMVWALMIWWEPSRVMTKKDICLS